MITFEHDHFECMCDSDEHFFRVSYFKDEDGNISSDIDDDLYVSIQLPDQSLLGYFEWNDEVPWWKVWKKITCHQGRLWRGIKYIFGYNCKYGYWETTSLSRQEARRLRDLLTRFINSNTKGKVS